MCAGAGLVMSELIKRGTRGQVIDLVVLLSNLLVVQWLSSLVRQSEGFDPLFGVLLILAVAFYSAGAWLKRLPLQQRLSKQPARNGTFFPVLLFVLLVMHLGLFIAAPIFALEILESSSAWSWFSRDSVALGAIALGLVPTVLVIRALIPAEAVTAADGRASGSAEFWADLFIFLSLIVIFAWWDGIYVELIRSLPPQHWALELLLFVLMLVPFAMFYLAPRVLFLIEDYYLPSAWLTIFLAVTPLIWRN